MAVSRATPNPLAVRETRSKRFRLLDGLQHGVTSLDRLTHCRRDRAYDSEWVGIIQRDGFAAFSGLQTCRSAWACPLCSATIRHERGLALAAVTVDWAGSGGGLLFPTLTLAHVKSDALAETLRHLIDAWAYVRSHRSYKEMRARLGIAHVVRTVEVTYGYNGWHPHLHALLFTTAPLTVEQVHEVRTCIWRLWNAYAERHRLRALNETRAVFMRVAGLDNERRLEALGKYLSKVQDGYGIASEMVRADLKRGRRSSRSHFALAEAAVAGSSRDRHLWHEYEAATHRRHVLEWSSGAKQALGYDERPDEDLVEDAADSQLVYDLTPYEWSLVLRYRRRGYLLNQADGGGRDAVIAACEAMRRRHRIGAKWS